MGASLELSTTWPLSNLSENPTTPVWTSCPPLPASLTLFQPHWPPCCTPPQSSPHQRGFVLLFPSAWNILLSDPQDLLPPLLQVSTHMEASLV